jgi:hypothetical protein
MSSPSTRSRVKEWLSDFRGRLSVSAGFPFCNASLASSWPVHHSLPIPPDVQFSRVRRSDSLRPTACVPDDSAPDVDDAQGIQSHIRVFLPPKASAFTAIVQIARKRVLMNRCKRRKASLPRSTLEPFPRRRSEHEVVVSRLRGRAVRRASRDSDRVGDVFVFGPSQPLNQLSLRSALPRKSH